jgi:hypothetical protein
MSVCDDIRSGKYENKVPYSIPDMEPINETKTTIARARELRAAHTTAKVEQRRLWQAEEGRMIDLLRTDLEAEHGVTGHPKAGVLWSLAWQHGHSGGLQDVVSHYEEFVELLG